MPAPIIIGALSARTYEDRRELCRNTWVKRAWDLGVPTYFLIGDSGLFNPETYDDELWLPVGDGYSYLPSKSIAFFRWALSKPGWDYLLKCDDDTWVHVSRLIQYDMTDCDYAGVEWSPGAGYASGAGYILSRKAAQVAVDTMKAPVGAEDLLIGHQLIKHGCPLRNDKMHFTAFANLKRRPQPDNELITAHVGTGQSNWLRNGRALFEACEKDFPDCKENEA